MIIYLAVGVAFLAVSLWAFLSNGKSARAIRYKYKLGGLMLTAWTMLSAASCEGGTPPVVTCYEPVVTCYDVAMETDILSVEVKGYGGTKLKSGDVLLINIDSPSYKDYRCRITATPENGDDSVIVVQDFTRDYDSELDKARFELTLPETDYKGTAKLTVCGVYYIAEGTQNEAPVGSVELEIF